VNLERIYQLLGQAGEIWLEPKVNWAGDTNLGMGKVGPALVMAGSNRGWAQRGGHDGLEEEDRVEAAMGSRWKRGVNDEIRLWRKGKSRSDDAMGAWREGEIGVDGIRAGRRCIVLG
jgi:hypothetical protein